MEDISGRDKSTNFLECEVPSQHYILAYFPGSVSEASGDKVLDMLGGAHTINECFIKACSSGSENIPLHFDGCTTSPVVFGELYSSNHLWVRLKVKRKKPRDLSNAEKEKSKSHSNGAFTGIPIVEDLKIRGIVKGMVYFAKCADLSFLPRNLSNKSPEVSERSASSSDVSIVSYRNFTSSLDEEPLYLKPYSFIQQILPCSTSYSYRYENKGYVPVHRTAPRLPHYTYNMATKVIQISEWVTSKEKRRREAPQDYSDEVPSEAPPMELAVLRDMSDDARERLVDLRKHFSQRPIWSLSSLQRVQTSETARKFVLRHIGLVAYRVVGPVAFRTCYIRHGYDVRDATKRYENALWQPIPFTQSRDVIRSIRKVFPNYRAAAEVRPKKTTYQHKVLQSPINKIALQDTPVEKDNRPSFAMLNDDLAVETLDQYFESNMTAEAINKQVVVGELSCTRVREILLSQIPQEMNLKYGYVLPAARRTIGAYLRDEFVNFLKIRFPSIDINYGLSTEVEGSTSKFSDTLVASSAPPLPPLSDTNENGDGLVDLQADDVLSWSDVSILSSRSSRDNESHSSILSDSDSINGIDF